MRSPQSRPDDARRGQARDHRGPPPCPRDPPGRAHRHGSAPPVGARGAFPGGGRRPRRCRRTSTASVEAGAHFASVRRSPTSPTIRRRQVRRSPSAGWRAHSGDGVWPVATATPADDSPDRAGGGEVLRTWAAIAIGGAQAFARHAVPAVRRPTPSRRRTSASYRRFPPTLAGFRDVAGGAGQLAAPSAELLRHPETTCATSPTVFG